MNHLMTGIYCVGVVEHFLCPLMDCDGHFFLFHPFPVAFSGHALVGFHFLNDFLYLSFVFFVAFHPLN